MTSEGVTLQLRFGITLKWAAQEVLNDEGLRLESDVYSYAMVLWEIVSREVPWKYTGIKELIVKAMRGTSPDVPTGAPPLFVSVMQECRVAAPPKRLTFSDVLIKLVDL